MRVVALNGSPRPQGRTGAALEAALAGANGLGATTELVHCRQDGDRTALTGAGAVILGTPVYRASLSGELKTYLDWLPNGLRGDDEGPLRGTAVGIVVVGGDDHHFLAVRELVDMLVVCFAAYVVPPGLYLTAADFDGRGGVASPDRVARLGAMVVHLARALGDDRELTDVRPQV